MSEENVKLVVGKLLNEDLSPAKIKAYATVIEALRKDSMEKGPNEIPENLNDLTEGEPPDMSEVQGVQIGNAKPKKVKIYKNR